MIHHDQQHIRTYILFFFVSIVLIGSLAYYFAPRSTSGLRSSVLGDTSDPYNEPVVSGEVSAPSSEEVLLTPEETSEKRMRFTKLLLKYQAELQALEAGKMDSLGDMGDPEIDQKIASLSNRIENLQNIISSLSGENISEESLPEGAEASED